jgi:hypothetical protein
MANVEQFQNATGQPSVLMQPITSGATSCVVSNPGNFSSLEAGQQFRMAVQDTPQSLVELVMVTATSGTTFTIQRGIERTMPAAHIAGAAVAQVVTAGIQEEIWPNGILQTANGNFSWPNAAVKKIVLNQETASACTVSIDPTALVPWQSYSLKDGAYICEAYAIILQPLSGAIDNDSDYQLNEAGQCVSFYSDTVNLWIE